MHASMFKIWEAFLDDSATPRSLHRLLVDNAKLTWFDIDLTNHCNLLCNHCFYHDLYTDKDKEGLSLELLDEAIRQAFVLAVRVLTFSGKEATLAKHFREAIRLARSWRDRHAEHAKVGMISNGLALPRHLSFLQSEPPDFIDISFDGWNYQNLIRSNSRDRVLASIDQATKMLPTTRIGTSTVIRNDSWRDILVMVRQLARMELVQHFYFEPVVAAVDKTIPSLNEEVLIRFVRELERLAGEHVGPELHFTLLLNGDQALPLFKRQLLRLDAIDEDDYHSLFVRKTYRSANIDYILRIVPEYYWRSARLSYDGFFLGSCDLLQAPNFRIEAGGSFARLPDLERLFRQGLGTNSLFFRTIESLFCEPCAHESYEKQYCVECFSTRLVSYMHRQYGSKKREFTGNEAGLSDLVHATVAS